MRLSLIPSIATVFAVQSAAFPDTIVARMVADHGLLDWTNGILAFVVLLLGIATLVTLIMLLVTLRRSINQTNTLLAKFLDDAKPIMTSVAAVTTDAREVVAMLRTDVERVTDATSLISQQLIDMADAAAQRVDDVNAVLDVLQDEIESSAIGTIAAVRGVRVGTRELSKRLRTEPDDESDDE